MAKSLQLQLLEAEALVREIKQKIAAKNPVQSTVYRQPSGTGAGASASARQPAMR